MCTEDLADEFGKAIFLVGAPAQSEDEIGRVQGIATTDALEAELRDANIDLAAGAGIVGGITGALARDCYHYDVPAVVLVVHTNPYLPDPAAARAVIETALEPLVEFDIDTHVLEEEEAEIQAQLQQIAAQYQQAMEQSDSQGETRPIASMYQ